MQALRLLPPACDKVLHLRRKDEWGSVPIAGGCFIIHDVFEFILPASLCCPNTFTLLYFLTAACLCIHLPFEASKLLCVAHNLAKVDVKHVSAVFQHDVVIVAVTNPQDEGGHAPTRTRVDEVHHGLWLCGKARKQDECTRVKCHCWDIKDVAVGVDLLIVLIGFVPHVKPFL